MAGGTSDSGCRRSACLDTRCECLSARWSDGGTGRGRERGALRPPSCGNLSRRGRCEWGRGKLRRGGLPVDRRREGGIYRWLELARLPRGRLQPHLGQSIELLGVHLIGGVVLHRPEEWISGGVRHHIDILHEDIFGSAWEEVSE